MRAHDVLLAADHGSKTAKTHNEECDASFATIYRRVSVLQDHDLIEKRNTVDPDGSHRNKFEMALEEFHIEITDGTFSLTLETRDMLADDYTSFWTDRRGDD
ncbi:transcriptional regulator [Natrinema gelatinilyticum]|uniref:transcriptional regulator n=1 Tax=Natrinema gelatinilyticum TaxID=2961571 RepID=UPI003CE5BFE1